MISKVHTAAKVVLLIVSLSYGHRLFAATPVAGAVGAQTGAFATSLSSASFDPASAAEWVDGSERPLANPNALKQLLWTQSAGPSTGPLKFGVSNQPGARYLRLGFTGALPVGSILVRGGDVVSVLRPGASYPGNLADESQWIPAQRLVEQQPSKDEVGPGDFALWSLPSVTSTRAIRFTHVAKQTDPSYEGVLGGVYLLSNRLVNLAPQAIATASTNNGKAPLLIDEQYNGWHLWDNGPEYHHTVSASAPEWIVLSWPKTVSLSGLAALWAGFDAADVQAFQGPDGIAPQGASESDWHVVGQPYSFRSQYPRGLGVDWMDFGKTIQTRAVRLRMTQSTDESHPHLKGLTHDGTRVWLGELMALSPLGSADLDASVLPMSVNVASGPHPPIPVKFSLDVPGYVTLVIEDAKGNRVRNLISNTWFEAGPQTVWWDGTDDLERNPDAAAHGVYLIPTHFVAPGRYQVRGLYHKAIDVHFEFSVYTGGHTAWETADGKGGWLTNHTPPSAALFLPADKSPGGKPLVYLGSYVSEGGSGLAWVDLDGNKQGGRGWVGGSWTAAPFLARDAGSHGDPAVYAYVGASWRDEATKATNYSKGLVRITALTTHGDKSVIVYNLNPGEKLDRDETGKANWMTQMDGLAVHDNLLVISLNRMSQLLFVEAVSGKPLGTTPVDNPRGVAFDSQGRLLVLSGKALLRYTLPKDAIQLQPGQIAKPETLISAGLEDPEGVTVAGAGDAEESIFVSDRGNSNQVKVFSESGKMLRAIGHAGPLQVGRYDEQHMNNPKGMAIDSNNHLWVTEEDFQPKRVSLWTLDGKFLKAFYGPSEYGGGGSIDPTDKTLFYYHAMQFKLDWKAGNYSLDSILYRPTKDDLVLPKFGAPTTVVYHGQHRYFTNCYMDYGTNGVSIATLFLEKGGTIHPVAAVGRANDWSIFQADAFKALWPKGTDYSDRRPDNAVQFSWSDTNMDGKVEPEEVTFFKTSTGSITVMPDLSMVDAFVDGKAVRYVPSVSRDGRPSYDIQNGQVIVDGVQRPKSDGGGQALYSPQNIVLSTAPLPFAGESVGGVDLQGHRWSYPSLWPGLHASHSAPVPDHPGELIGTTRLLGDFIHPSSEDVGPIWGINSNMGDMYLFTADGFFITQLFQDSRVGKLWAMPDPKRNMLLNDLSLHDENFFPSLTQTPDGKVYVVDGGRTSIVRVDGLDTMRRLPSTPLNLSATQLQEAQKFQTEHELARQQQTGAKSLEVKVISGATPSIGDLASSWKSAKWATVDRRITQVGWNANPDVVEAAVEVVGDRLFASFHTGDPKLLENADDVANAPFKTGGALDLMIGVNPTANTQRQNPVEGDVRLLVYQVEGKTKAMLYRAIVPGTRTPVPFSSPSRTITLDQVEDVSTLVELSVDGGNYTFSVPLKTLGLKPTNGEKIKADIGILRGNGSQTVQRVYWNNKATGITSDVPSEAELVPGLWGDWVFQCPR